MIEQDRKMNPKVVGAIITNMSELIKDDSSSDGESMLGLQELAREDLSSNNDTDSYGDDEIYEKGEPWKFKALTLKKIIGGTPGGVIPNNIATLYGFSWHRYTKIFENPMNKTKESDLYQAKD